MILFANWREHYGNDEELNGASAAALTAPMASEHQKKEYTIHHKGQLVKRHMVVVHKGIVAKVIQDVHAYCHNGIDRTMELIK